MGEDRQTFKGRDLAEAIAAARQHFGVGRQEIEFEVRERAKIGAVDAAGAVVEISAWVREGGPRELPAERPPRGGPRRDDRGGPRREDDRGPRRDDRGPRADRGPREDRGPRGPRRERGEDRDGPRFDRPRGAYAGGPRREDAEGGTYRAPAGEAPNLGPLFPAPEVTDAHEILRTLSVALVEGLGLALTFDGIDETEAGLRVKLDGEDVALLLEADAEGLDALQYLANRLLHKDGRIAARVSFDAGGHRARAEARIVASAREMAAEVKATGQARKMAALGPYERRLVHLALAETEGIRTFSTGSGYHRRLHIVPADAPAEESSPES